MSKHEALLSHILDDDEPCVYEPDEEDLQMEIWEKRIEEAILASGQKKVRVIYSVEADVDKVAVEGKVVLVGFADDFWGGKKSKNYHSEVLINPTWLEVAVRANEMIRVTRDTHHSFLEGLDKPIMNMDVGVREDDVTLYEFMMGS
jgi:hypothetical protein